MTKKGERERKSKLKKISLTKKILLSILVVVTMGGLILISPLFTIQKINFPKDIEPDLKNSILAALEDSKGKNGFLYVASNVSGIENIEYLLKMRAKYIEDKIAFEESCVSNIKVEFKFPDTINVTFGKRKAAFFINISDYYICTDAEGFVIGIYTDKNNFALPVVAGIELNMYKVGQYISSDNSERMDVLRKLFKEINNNDLKEEYNLLSNIEMIDVSEYNTIWMFLNNGISVKLGDMDNISYKIPALKEILTSEEIAGKNGRIDFTVASGPVFKEGR